MSTFSHSLGNKNCVLPLIQEGKIWIRFNVCQFKWGSEKKSQCSIVRKENRKLKQNRAFFVPLRFYTLPMFGHCLESTMRKRPIFCLWQTHSRLVALFLSFSRPCASCDRCGTVRRANREWLNFVNIWAFLTLLFVHIFIIDIHQF